MAWLGLDFGTSSAKALLVDDAGTVLARATASYPLATGPGGQSEQDPGDYLRACRALLAEIAGAGDIDGIGLVGQNPTQVFVDRSGAPLRPAITWQDMRAVAEANELAATLGNPVPLVGTSLAWAPTNAPAKLLWLSRHEPETRRATWLVLQPKDYVGFALSGAPLVDAWASKGICNVLTGEPAYEVMAAVGWPASVVPDVGLPWAPRGAVTRDASASFGLPTGVPVAVGWSDALAPMLGIGGFDAPCGVIVTGTSDVGGVVAEDVPSDGGALYSVPAACAPLPVVYGPTQTSGAAVAWLAGLLHLEPAAVVRLAGQCPPAGKGDPPPVFVPYLAGERAPVWRTDVRGAFLGLSLNHDDAALARSVLTGVACTTRHLFDEAASIVGWRPETIYMGGLAAADPVSRAIRAGVLGSPIVVRAEPHSSTLGAAMLGAGAAGVPLNELSRLAGSPFYYEPPQAEVDAGQQAYARFRAATDCLLS